MKVSLLTVLCICCCFAAYPQQPNDRKIWLDYLDKVARPVMQNLAADQLHANMPVELSERIDNRVSRAKVAHLEAFARTLSGIAPWLQLEAGDAEEQQLRSQYRNWALQGIANAVNPASRDYMQWTGGQPLVDASFFALGLIRAPWLWEHLDEAVKKNIVAAFLRTRETVPGYNNWILFSGMIEAFFRQYELPYDPLRVEYGVREFTQHWYVGDGMYSDGNNFHFDYYNGIVIQPYLATILEVFNRKNKNYGREKAHADTIAKRYAQIQERLINTDGSYPATGRSIVYRGGVFHHLADMALRKQLPANLAPAQIRGALTAVIRKTLGADKTFNEKGWLNIGLAGNQPGLADVYITTGSLYLCADIFLPLGLSPADEFWSAAATPWSAVKIWNGQNAELDHALDTRQLRVP
jgi:hypothetical protein